MKITRSFEEDNNMSNTLMGYRRVELIDTTNGIFMSHSEAKWMALSGSALLVGKK